MFDVGFWELCMIGLLSLLVIGPEQLPKVARLAGFWIGKSQRITASVKQEISQELKAEEIRQLLKQQNLVGELNHLDNKLKSALTTATAKVTQVGATEAIYKSDKSTSKPSKSEPPKPYDEG